MSRPPVGGGGIKPVVGSGPRLVGGPIAGRRAGKAPGTMAPQAQGRGLSRAAVGAKSQPALVTPPKEQAISAAKLLSLLGAGSAYAAAGGGSSGSAMQDLRGMFSAQDERAQPALNPKIHEFAPVGGPRGGRRYSGGEDIITGIKKQQPQMNPAYEQQGGRMMQPQHHHQQQPPEHWQQNAPPQQQSQYTQPSYPQQQPQQHHPQASYPSHQASASVDYSSPPAPNLSSPAAKNRARAMGSTIFSSAAQDGDLPGNTITGHFRGRVASAAPAPGNRPGQQQTQQQQQQQYPPSTQQHFGDRSQQHQQQQQADPYSNYLNNSTMLHGGGEATRRQQPVHGPYDEKTNPYQQQPGQGQGQGQGPPPSSYGRDPYARQQAHQNPYDTRDSSIYTQRAQPQQQGQGYPAYDQTSRQPASANEYHQVSPPHSPSRMRQNLPQSYGGYSGHTASPPHSPSHVPRASWGGGDVSQHEVGSVGHRDERMRKQEEVRAALDAQVRERQAAAAMHGGGGGAGVAGSGEGKSKSTKYAIRHRERQAELAAEQAKLNGGGQIMQQQQQQMDHGYPPQQQQHQQQAFYNNTSYPSAVPGLPSSSSPSDPYNGGVHVGGVGGPPLPQSHSRIRSDLHAGSGYQDSSEKMRQQNEFRAHLAEQVRAKEMVKERAKREKDEEDRAERVRLGLGAMPTQGQQQPGGQYMDQMNNQQQQQQQYGNNPPHPGQQQQQQYSSHPQQQQQQQQQQQFDYNSNAYGGAPISPSHQQQQQYPPGSQVTSPSKLAENRSKAMASNIFAGGGGEIEKEKKDRERLLAQEAFAEQVATRKRQKEAEEAREREMDRKDNARIAFERLEMVNRLQGLDPATAAAKARETLAEAENAAMQRAPSQQQLPNNHQQHQQQQAHHQGGQSGVSSPSNAKTMMQVPGHHQPPQQQQQQQQQSYHDPPPHFDQGVDSGDEENIAKLTALTSAMNRKVTDRRAKANQQHQQEFEDSRALGGDEEGGGGASAHAHEESASERKERKRVSAAAAKSSSNKPSGRRAGDANTKEKRQGGRDRSTQRHGSAAGAAGSRRDSPSPSTHRRSRNDHTSPSSRSRGTSRSRKSSARGGGGGAASKKKVSAAAPVMTAAQRAREYELAMVEKVEARKKSILARARREAASGRGGDTAEDDDDDDGASQSEYDEPRLDRRERKQHAVVGGRARSKSIAGGISGGGRGAKEDGRHRSNSRVGSKAGAGAPSMMKRGVSGQGRGAAAGGGMPPAHPRYDPHPSHHRGDQDDDIDVEVQHYPHESEGDSSARGYADQNQPAHGSRIPGPRVQSGKKRRPLPQQQQLEYFDEDSSKYDSPRRRSAVGPGAGASSDHAYSHHPNTGGYLGGHNHHKQVRSPPNRFPQPYGMVGGGGAGTGGSQQQQQQANSNQVSVDQYPWFAQAAGNGSALDASLSGNSAFILLPSSSTYIAAASARPGSILELESMPPSRSASRHHLHQQQQQPQGADDIDDGILPDELEKLMGTYGGQLQAPSANAAGNGALANVFDTNLIPGTIVPISTAGAGSAAAGAASARRSGTSAAAAPLSPGSKTSRVGSAKPTNTTPRIHTASRSMHDQDATATAAAAGGANPELLSPLSPGGESLGVASQEWLAGSILSPSAAQAELNAGDGGGDPTYENASFAEESMGAVGSHGAVSAALHAAFQPERALSPGAHVMQPSASRSSLGLSGGMAGAAAGGGHSRPMPRVVDPFSKLAPEPQPPQ